MCADKKHHSIHYVVIGSHISRDLYINIKRRCTHQIYKCVENNNSDLVLA